MKKTIIPVICALALFLSAPAWSQDSQDEDMDDAVTEETQPLSLSLVECSVIYDTIAETAKSKEKPAAMIEKFETMSDNFRTAAADQAKDEGIEEIEEYLVAAYKSTLPKWEDKVGSILDLPDTVNWIRYCGALANERGLVPE